MWPEIRKFASELPLVGPALRSAYRKSHGLPDVEGAQSDAPDFKYHSWIERRVRERAVDYPAPKENAPRFDILTLVFNTDPEVLRKAAASVFAQDYAHFRWVIWDNGSTNLETRAALTEIMKDARVHFHRSEQNLGINNGHLKALELCDSEYIALFDHDDLLYPDALRINAWHIDVFGRPDFLYSDEDKCDMQDRRYWPYFKPDFSPALLLDSGYTCHLSVAKRATLLVCGAFTDPLVEGAQDWDMALHIQDFLKLNYKDRIVHIPEILYTWRGVPESTAVRGVEAKPHVIAAQKRCVESALERRGLRDEFEPTPNEKFKSPDGHWWCSRKRTIESAITVFQLSDESASSKVESLAKLRATIHSISVAEFGSVFSSKLPNITDEFVAVITGRLLKSDLQNWLLEAIRILTLNPNAAITVGRTVNNSSYVQGGPHILIGKFSELPTTEWSDQGYFARNLCHHDVSNFFRASWIGRRSAINSDMFKIEEFPNLWETDLCIQLLQNGREIVYSPLINTPNIVRPTPSEEETIRFIRAHHDLIRDDPYYSPFCSLKAESLYSIVEPAERAAVLNPLFEKAGVPLVPTDRYELGRYSRLRRKNP